MVDFETDDESALETTITQLRIKNPEKNIFPYVLVPFISETILGSIEK